jgi:hypothetical protein
MVMDWRDGALGLAGVLGCTVALVHGTLIQRLLVRPLAAPSDVRMAAPVRRLIGPLLHFSTYNWFLGGLALLAIAIGLAPGARLMTGLLVGSSYLFGAAGNAWATRGRHPGWMLMALALVLIVLGVYKP